MRGTKEGGRVDQGWGTEGGRGGGTGGEEGQEGRILFQDKEI